MKNAVKLKFLTRTDTTTTEFYRAFFNVLIERHPHLAPEFFDFYERCKRPFTGLEECRDRWATLATLSGGSLAPSVFPQTNFIKRKSKLRYLAHISPTRVIRKTGKLEMGRITFWMARDRKMAYLQLFRDLISVVRPVLGRIHIFLGAETGVSASGDAETAFYVGPSERDIAQGLTNIGWAEFFGEDYAKEVDDELLLQHGFGVETIADGKLFHVTDSIFDLVDDFGKFSRRRAELKALFRPGLFRITEEPEMTPLSRR